MHIASWKMQLGTAWVVAVVLVGFAVGTASLAGWVAVAVLALAVPVIFIRFWRRPERSMSENIRDVLR